MMFKLVSGSRCHGNKRSKVSYSMQQSGVAMVPSDWIFVQDIDATVWS